MLDEGIPGNQVPILALAREGDLRIATLSAGRNVDDFITFPFTPDELLVRVSRVVRAAHTMEVGFSTTVLVGDIEIDIIKRSVRVANEDVVHPTPIETALLCLFAANPGRVLSRNTILDELWGRGFSAHSNIVDQHVGSLRIKLQSSDGQPRFIFTIPRRGYRFVLSARPLA